jgi:xanthine dehydrogenase YagR molybdenum-binding subunit
MSQGTFGQPIPRVDGPLKVTGRATYAAEFDPPNMAHAVIVTSTIARTHQTLETAAAERATGVLSVITPRNAPRLAYRAQ